MNSTKHYSITKNGKALDKKLYTLCEKTKTFSSNEDGLVLDFSGVGGWTFTTGHSCTFTNGSHCTFASGHSCTFKTWDDCTFKTGSYCTFTTGHSCTFKTGSDCTFKTGSGCTFKTGGDCAFTTGSNCTFKTGANCVIVRRDVYEIIEIPEHTTIKLNDYRVKGYKVLPKTYEIVIDGKVITLSKESFESLKESLLD